MICKRNGDNKGDNERDNDGDSDGECAGQILVLKQPVTLMVTAVVTHNAEVNNGNRYGDNDGACEHEKEY